MAFMIPKITWGDGGGSSLFVEFKGEASPKVWFEPVPTGLVHFFVS
jgi:hypothetical protein